MSETNGTFSPRRAGRFGVVVEAIESKSPAEGFELARNLMFERFEVLSKKMPPYAVLKLAIEFDKHAKFCEIASERARARTDSDVYKQFQEYLSGAVDVAPTIGNGPASIAGPDGLHVSVDDLPDAEMDGDAVEGDEE